MPFIDFFLRPQTYGSLYFCNHLYEAYHGNEPIIRKLTFVNDHREALLYCHKCSKENIVKYSKFNHCSKEFFEDAKRNLIQHFVTEGESNSAFKNCVLIDYFTIS